MKIKAILFDLDGTLVDTTEFIYQAYEYALSLHRFEIKKREVLAPLIGRSLHEMYQIIAPLGNPKILAESHINFQSMNFHLVKSFPNTNKTLDKLKKLNLKLGIITGRYKNTLDTLKAAEIDPLIFDVIVNGEDVVHGKPDPEGVILALKELIIKPEQAILVGDGTADIEMGKNAKVKTVGVTYGFGGKAIKESNPDYIINDLMELLEVVR